MVGSAATKSPVSPLSIYITVSRIYWRFDWISVKKTIFKHLYPECILQRVASIRAWLGDITLGCWLHGPESLVFGSKDRFPACSICMMAQRRRSEGKRIPVLNSFQAMWAIQTVKQRESIVVYWALLARISIRTVHKASVFKYRFYRSYPQLNSGDTPFDKLGLYPG